MDEGAQRRRDTRYPSSTPLFSWEEYPQKVSLRPSPEGGPRNCTARSVPVEIALEGPSHLHADVVGLLLTEYGHLGTKGREV